VAGGCPPCGVFGLFGVYSARLGIGWLTAIRNQCVEKSLMANHSNDVAINDVLIYSVVFCLGNLLMYCLSA
jgi:hypothetical protein